MPPRTGPGPLIALLGAALLLIGLFLDWYQPGLSAWTVFEALDLVLALIAVAALVLALDRLGIGFAGPGAAGGSPGLRVPGPALAGLGAAALVVVFSQLVNHPPATAGPGHDPEEGAWLALAGAVLLALGGLLSFARVSLAVEPGPGSPATGPGRGPSPDPGAGAPAEAPTAPVERGRPGRPGEPAPPPGEPPGAQERPPRGPV